MLPNARPNAVPIWVQSAWVFCAASQFASLIDGFPKPYAVQRVLQLRPAIVSLHQSVPFTVVQFGLLTQRLLTQTFCPLQTFEQNPQLLLSVLPLTSHPSFPPLQSRK